MSLDESSAATEATISAGLTVPAGIVLIFVAIGDFFSRVGTKLQLRAKDILEVLIKNFYLIVFFLIPTLVISLLITEFQIEVTPFINIFYSIFYAVYDLFMRNVAIPIRIGVEFLLRNFNDLVLYIFGCVSMLFTDVKAIPDLFTVNGIITAFLKSIAFFSDCLLKVFQNIWSWKIPYIADTFQHAANIGSCAGHIARIIITLTVYVIESFISHTFSFVDFYTLCSQLVGEASYCINNFLKFITFEDTIGPLLEYVADHPISFTFPTTDSMGVLGNFITVSTAAILKPGFNYDDTILPILVTGLTDFLTIVFMFGK